MIKCAPNVINLVSLLSGLYVYFQNNPEARHVTTTIVSGNILAGEGIKITSDKCQYRIDVSTAVDQDGALDVRIWEDGGMVHQIESVADSAVERRELKNEIIAILKGDKVFE